MPARSEKIPFQKAATDSLIKASETTDKERAVDLRQEAQVLALLAIADELSAIRETVTGIEKNLEDNDGYPVGTHLRYINDWLERIAKRD